MCEEGNIFALELEESNTFSVYVEISSEVLSPSKVKTFCPPVLWGIVHVTTKKLIHLIDSQVTWKKHVFQYPIIGIKYVTLHFNAIYACL